MSDEIAEARAALARTVADLAREAVNKATQLGFALDFTEGSLPILEQLLAKLASYDMAEHQQDNAAHLFSAYVLEVARRAHGGYFQFWEERDAPVLVVGAPAAHVGLLALDKVRGRIAGDASDNVPFFYEGFSERARRRQPGDSATYV